MNFKDYAILSSDSEFEVIEEGKQTLAIPLRDIEGNCDAKVYAGYLPDTYLSIVKKCKIIGGSNAVVINNKYLLYDLLHKVNENPSLNFFVTDSARVRVLNKFLRIGCYYLFFHNKKGIKIKKGIHFIGNFSNNYYHFIVEFIAKFYLLDKLQLPKDIPLICDSSVTENFQYRELIRLFSDREILCVDELNYCTVEQMYYLSFVNQVPPNFKDVTKLKYEDVLIDFDSIDFVRKNVFSKIHIKVEQSCNLYISRKNFSRRSYNEEAVLNVLKQYNFEVIYPENMTFEEQVNKFSNANIIIAASGAALANILFCSRGCRILVFMSKPLKLAIFSSIAQYLFLDMRYLFGNQVADEKNIQSGFEIDIEKVKNYLEKNIRK